MNDQPQPLFNPAECSSDARKMLRARIEGPVSLLRKHDRAFWRGAHAGKS